MTVKLVLLPAEITALVVRFEAVRVLAALWITDRVCVSDAPAAESTTSLLAQLRTTCHAALGVLPVFVTVTVPENASQVLPAVPSVQAMFWT